MKRFLLISALVLFSVAYCVADDREKDIERLQTAGQVLDEIMSAPDRGIPQQVIDSAECVAIVPSMLKGGFGFGGEVGKGVVTCRNANGWSAPAFFRIEGGSFGLQIGGQAVDLVMLVMNQRGMQALLASHVKLGADASAAAGPVGRLAEGMTDISMRAEILTYSRARGLFAGVSLNGAVVKQHKDDTRAFYGRMIPFKLILTGGVNPPSEAQPFLSTVAKYNKGKAEASGQVATATQVSTPAANASTANSATASTSAAPAQGASAPSQPASRETSSAQSATSASTAQPAGAAAGEAKNKPDPTTPKMR
jgi:lipid-binding SYLF domain-containing protein